MHAGLKLKEKSLQMLPFVAKVEKAAGKKDENGSIRCNALKAAGKKREKWPGGQRREKVVCIRMVTVMAFASLR